MEKEKKIGHLALLSANILFGLNTPISRSLMPEILAPSTLSFFRIAGGTILFWTISLVVKKEYVPLKDVVLLFFASVFALVLNQIPFFVGLSMTSPIDASIVVTMLPIVTMILAAIILKEPITFKKAIGVLIGATGALLLVFSSKHVSVGQSSLTGDMIVLGAVISFALYLTLFKSLIMRYSAITLMKWMFLFGTIMCYPFCHQSLVETDFSLLGHDTFLRIGYIVVIATFLTYMLIPVGQKVLRPTTFSMYNYLQPVVASLAAVAMGIDHFGVEQGISGILVFAGVYIVTTSKSRVQLEAEKQMKNKK